MRVQAKEIQAMRRLQTMPVRSRRHHGMLFLHCPPPGILL
jgi:hypothetical protein